ncbi:MAG: hypothetical protein AB1696_02035 [Planctomycetota bacterium]
MHDIRNFIESVREIVASHNLGEPGAYRRWNRQNADSTRDLSLNPYGCADAANILYTIGFFPRDSREREGFVQTLRSQQDSETGLFRERNSVIHEIHTTAHCIAALELFDALPEHPLAGLSEYRDPKAMEAFLDGLDWRANPWGESHKGAGVYVALVLAGEVSLEWEDRYFAWLFRETDPETGFLRKGCIAPIEMGGTSSIFPHLAGAFHYLFNQEYARRPIRYPQAMIDTCLDLFNSGHPVGKRGIGYAGIDWVFCLTRSLRQCGHRYEDCREALAAFLDCHMDFLLPLDPHAHEGMNDLHALFGTICCLAELQTALPGQIRTERPLKLVLDRRPFI